MLSIYPLKTSQMSCSFILRGCLIAIWPIPSQINQLSWSDFRVWYELSQSACLAQMHDSLSCEDVADSPKRPSCPLKFFSWPERDCVQNQTPPLSPPSKSSFPIAVSINIEQPSQSDLRLLQQLARSPSQSPIYSSPYVHHTGTCPPLFKSKFDFDFI